MARERQKYVTLYNPDNGTEVEVPESRAETLKGRGFTTAKPRNPGAKRRKTQDGGDNSAMQAEIDRLTAENEAMKAEQAQTASGNKAPADTK